MRAPLSWIREYVDLPASVSVDDLTWKLTMLGLKLEAVHTAGAAITGPLVVGRVLTIDHEPQKNGKVINWCTVDVGDANGTGEPQGIVCGAHNFAEGDLVVVCLPGAVLPGNFEISARKTYGHVSAGMICSARELGLGEDGEGIIVLPADAGQPGDDAFAVLHLDDPVIEFEINPDRAYALSVRGIARDAALAYSLPFDDPAARDTPAANDDGYPVVVDDPAGCPVFVARTVTGFDPAAPTPDWMARRLAQAGMRPISLGVDVTNYVMLELGQPIHGYDRAKLSGAIRVRRATEQEQLTTLDGVRRTLSTEDLLITDDSGPIGIAGTMGGETTELSETTTDLVIEAAHFDAVSVFRTEKRHKLPSEASKRFERGVDPELPAAAADRVVELLAELGGGTVDPGVTVVGDPPPRRTHPDRLRPARPDHRHGHQRRGHHRCAAVGGLRGRRGLGGPDRDRAVVAPRSDRSLRPRRRGGQGRGLRQGAVGASLGSGRPGPHPGAEAAPPRRAGAGGRGLHRGHHLPVRRRRRLGSAGPRHRRRAPTDLADGQPAQRRGAAADHDAAPGHPARAGPERRPGQPRRRPVRAQPGVPADRQRGGPSPRRRPQADRGRVGGHREGGSVSADAPRHRAHRSPGAGRLVGPGPASIVGRRDRRGSRSGGSARAHPRRGRSLGRPLAPGPLRRDPDRRHPHRPRR